LCVPVAEVLESDAPLPVAPAVAANESAAMAIAILQSSMCDSFPMSRNGA